MSSQELRTVAMMNTWLDGWYQSALWRAAVKAAKSQGVRLVALVNYARPGDRAQSGTEGIWGLALRSDFQGVLLSSGPVSFWEGESVLHKIRDWLYPKPAVSLGLNIPQMDSVIIAGDGVSEVVTHLVKYHGCKKIAWIAGPRNNQDAQSRFQGFKAGLELGGIELDERLVEDGGFTLEGGQVAMGILLERNPDIDAVIAANDSMAIGAMQKLRSSGIEVPKQIRIVGYDDIPEALLQSPTLTTLRNPIENTVLQGIQFCLNRIHSPFVSCRVAEEPCVPIYRESCGCSKSKELKSMESGLSDSLAKMAEFQVRIQSDPPRFLTWLEDLLERVPLEDYNYWEGQLSHSLSLAHQREFLLEAKLVLEGSKQKKHLVLRSQQDLLIREIQRIASAMNSNPDPKRMISNLSECLSSWCKSKIRLFLIDHEFSPTGLETNLALCRFDVRLEWSQGGFTEIPEGEDLLPAEYESGESWIAIPLEHGSMRFGVALLEGWQDIEIFIELFRVVLSISLADSWRSRSEKNLQDRLRHLIARDSQTQLWNRMGFLEAGHQMVAQAFREKNNVGILLLEMEDFVENLRKFGKEDTQLAVKIVADGFRECFRTSDILARLEDSIFIALFTLREAADHMRMLSRLQKNILEKAEKKMLPWRISTRAGWTVWDGMDGSTLKAQVEIALGRARGLGREF